jgi:hypothetical protein
VPTLLLSTRKQSEKGKVVELPLGGKQSNMAATASRMLQFPPNRYIFTHPAFWERRQTFLQEDKS